MPSAGELVQQVEDTATRLRAAQPEWDALGPAGRARRLDALRSWVLAHEAELTDLVVADTGKARTEAMAEVFVVCDLLHYWARHAPTYLAGHRVRPGDVKASLKRLQVDYRPHALVGLISPFNFPLGVACLDLVPALAAGCAVLWKPSELTPLSAVALRDGWRAIDAPDVLDVITGAGDAGAAVVDVADYVQFTGSTATGRKVAQQAAGRLTPFSVELGGKDAAVVLADADVGHAARGIAWGALMNGGQACVGVERVYVDAQVYDRFVSRLVAEVRALPAGPQPDGVSVLADERQCAIVQDHLDDAVRRGAKILTGGHRRGDGTFFEPTVLTFVDHDMACMRDETFGPLVPVMPFADEDDAVRLVNDSRYGLSASVWTRDVRAGERLATRLEVGAVNVNDAFANVYSYSLPQTGWKQSGSGLRSGGELGVRKFCRTQAVTAPRWPVIGKIQPHWYPYGPRRRALLRFMLKLLTGGR